MNDQDHIFIPLLAKKLLPEVVINLQRTLDTLFDAFTPPSLIYQARWGKKIEDRKLVFYNEEQQRFSVERIVSEYSILYIVRCGNHQELIASVNPIAGPSMWWSNCEDRTLPTSDQLETAMQVIGMIAEHYAVKAWREDKIRGVVSRLKRIHDAITGEQQELQISAYYKE